VKAGGWILVHLSSLSCRRGRGAWKLASGDTIIGIPFRIQHLKLAACALTRSDFM
jgi:uncharacterized membrane protein YccF (DUF307 family)